MATNRGVAYLETGKVEIQSIDFPKLALGDRKCEHGVLLILHAAVARIVKKEKQEFV